jgi:hypothetical protein
MQWDDLNIDLTASFRRFREQVLEGPSTLWNGMNKNHIEFRINHSINRFIISNSNI